MPTLPLIGAVLLLLAIYALAPGLTLLRINRAVRQGDTAALARLVDFPSVREGLAQEVAGGILGIPPSHQAHASGGLPPFGFSFVSRIADREIAIRLTPRGLIRLAHAGGPAGAPRAQMRLAGVWFDGPRRVIVRLHVTGQPQPIRLRLQLEHGGWKLDRVWLPQQLLRRAAAQEGGAGAAEPALTARQPTPGLPPPR